MGDRLFIGLLAVWAILFGLLHVTNFRIEAGSLAMGLAALCLGIVCVVRVAIGSRA